MSGNMDQSAVTQMERKLLFILKEEYSFYQSLYLTLDKQRDAVKYDNDDRLLELFTEIERCHKRIQRSEEKVAALKQKAPQVFERASANPDIRKIVNSIATMVKKNMNLVRECEEYLQERHQRIKDELGELKNSSKILQYLSDGSPTAQFVDGKS
jgi:exonuclease VII small subunit